jgi:hypothetical protein
MSLNTVGICCMACCFVPPLCGKNSPNKEQVYSSMQTNGHTVWAADPDLSTTLDAPQVLLLRLNARAAAPPSRCLHQGAIEPVQQQLRQPGGHQGRLGTVRGGQHLGPRGREWAGGLSWLGMPLQFSPAVTRNII